MRATSLARAGQFKAPLLTAYRLRRKALAPDRRSRLHSRDLERQAWRSESSVLARRGLGKQRDGFRRAPHAGRFPGLLRRRFGDARYGAPRRPERRRPTTARARRARRRLARVRRLRRRTASGPDGALYLGEEPSTFGPRPRRQARRARSRRRSPSRLDGTVGQSWYSESQEASRSRLVSGRIRSLRFASAARTRATSTSSRTAWRARSTPTSGSPPIWPGSSARPRQRRPAEARAPHLSGRHAAHAQEFFRRATRSASTRDRRSLIAQVAVEF